MPLDHFGYIVNHSKFEAEVKFLVAAFKHMGIKEMVRLEIPVAGLGEERPWLWVSGMQNRKPVEDSVEVTKNHIALTAKGKFELWPFIHPDQIFS
jgi:hypothetical protein